MLFFLDFNPFLKQLNFLPNNNGSKGYKEENVK